MKLKDSVFILAIGIMATNMSFAGVCDSKACHAVQLCEQYYPNSSEKLIFTHSNKRVEKPLNQVQHFSESGTLIGETKSIFSGSAKGQGTLLSSLASKTVGQDTTYSVFGANLGDGESVKESNDPLVIGIVVLGERILKGGGNYSSEIVIVQDSTKNTGGFVCRNSDMQLAN